MTDSSQTASCECFANELQDDIGITMEDTSQHFTPSSHWIS